MELYDCKKSKPQRYEEEIIYVLLIDILSIRVVDMCDVEGKRRTL